MKIAICSSFVPFIYGGGRHIVDWLEIKLREVGHQVETIYLPQVDTTKLIFQQLAANRWIDLADQADRIICIRPPSHFIQHPNKVLWFIHHIRCFYDLWDTAYSPVPNEAKWQGYRQAVINADTNALKEAKFIFTNSQTVSRRLAEYNKIDSEVLYPPLLDPTAFHYKQQNDELVYISRVEHHKRQHLLIEAIAYTKSPVKLRMCGLSRDPVYISNLYKLIKHHKLVERVRIEHRWISENEKIDLLANCLAAVYFPLDEDSYGYPSLEASHASKPIITTSDSGGVIELVKNAINGYVCSPTPRAIAESIDQLYYDRKSAKKMGQAALERIKELKIEWPHVIERLLA